MSAGSDWARHPLNEMTEQCGRGVGSLTVLCAADMPLHLTMKVALTTMRYGALYFNGIFFFPLLGASELLPLCLNLAVVRFNLNGYLDPLKCFWVSSCFAWQKAVTKHKHVIRIQKAFLTQNHAEPPRSSQAPPDGWVGGFLGTVCCNHCFDHLNNIHAALLQTGLNAPLISWTDDRWLSSSRFPFFHLKIKTLICVFILFLWISLDRNTLTDV